VKGECRICRIYAAPAVMRGERALQGVPRTAELPIVVVACSLNVQQHARLTDAARGRAELVVVEGFEHLAARLRETIGKVDVVVFPSRDTMGVEATSVIRSLSTARRATAFVAYCQLGTQYSNEIRSLVGAGVHEFVFSGLQDNAISFRRVLERARRECAADFVMARLAVIVPSALHRIVDVALHRPDEILDIKSLSASLGLRRRTLFKRCTDARFVGPGELLVWSRLTLVGYLLETTGCTIEKIANELAFPSPTALRNAMKRYTGLTAGEVRERGGLEAVVAALGSRMDEVRKVGAVHLL
jgi:AraC-like DNA-binding protein